MTEIVIKIEDESRVTPFLQMLKLFDFVSDVALKRGQGAQRQGRINALNAVYGEYDHAEEDENMIAMERLVSEVVEETAW